jgi:type VI secretion system secreted protein Hcp
MDKPASRADSGSDIFLHVQTKRAGKIKGESSTDGHVDDIEVTSASWGVVAQSAIGSSAVTSRRQYKHLVVLKRIDAASTGLLATLATNDEVKEARLTIRKSGGLALDYYVMKLALARVVGVDLEVDAGGIPKERVTFSYGKIDVDYKPQKSSGSSGGTTSFSDEVQNPV